MVNGILESEGKIAGPRTPAMAMAPIFQNHLKHPAQVFTVGNNWKQNLDQQAVKILYPRNNFSWKQILSTTEFIFEGSYIPPSRFWLIDNKYVVNY